MQKLQTVTLRSGAIAWLIASTLNLTASIAQADVDVVSSTQNATKVALAEQPSSRDWHNRRSLYYKRNWGIDVVGVHPVSSGQMLAFRYRVLDIEKAKILFDKTAKPYLIDEATGTRLAVPAMENVGELRQSPTPETDRTYFMIFGNPGKLVKPGGRVSFNIGSFYIDGLVVD